MQCQWIFHGEMALWHLGPDTIIDILIEGQYDKRKIKVTGKNDIEALKNMVDEMINLGIVK